MADEQNSVSRWLRWWPVVVFALAISGGWGANTVRLGAVEAALAEQKTILDGVVARQVRTETGQGWMKEALTDIRAKLERRAGSP